MRKQTRGRGWPTARSLTSIIISEMQAITHDVVAVCNATKSPSFTPKWVGGGILEDWCRNGVVSGHATSMAGIPTHPTLRERHRIQQLPWEVHEQYQALGWLVPHLPNRPGIAWFLSDSIRSPVTLITFQIFSRYRHSGLKNKNWCWISSCAHLSRRCAQQGLSLAPQFGLRLRQRVAKRLDQQAAYGWWWTTMNN